MNMRAPKLASNLPDASNLSTAGSFEPAQLSNWKGLPPGGTSGFAPQRSATHTETPSRSMSTPFRAPHFLPSGKSPQGAMLRYGLGRSFNGFISPPVMESAAHRTSAAEAARSVCVFLRFTVAPLLTVCLRALHKLHFVIPVETGIPFPRLGEGRMGAW